MRLIPTVLGACALVQASAILAQEAQPSPLDKPVTDDSVSAGDVALTPLTDLNLARDEIPELLVQARAAPYDMAGLDRCGDIVAAVEKLDIVLGEDLDTADAQQRDVNAGRIAQWAVGRFIPFRGLIREVSGARAHERKLRDAVIGGMMRRAYLKGLGHQKGCAYPARPAPSEDIQAIKTDRVVAQQTAIAEVATDRVAAAEQKIADKRANEQFEDAAERAADQRKAEDKRAARERREAEKRATQERKAAEKRAKAAEKQATRKQQADANDGPRYVSEPVVQPATRIRRR